MPERIPGFTGEYLWELDIARNQLLALGNAASNDFYPWRPTEGVRTFSAVLIHIAAVNFGLLHLAGLPGDNPCSDLDRSQMPALIERIISFERTHTSKSAVIEFLARSFDAVQSSLTSAAGRLDEQGHFFGEPTTLRRLFLRMLVHSHEHMGQAVAYARMFGMPLPWPDPLRGQPAPERAG